MFSPIKKLDQELLLEIVEMIEVLVQVGTTQAIDLAEKFGQNYLDLEKKIKTYDYTREDQSYFATEKIINNLK